MPNGSDSASPAALVPLALGCALTALAVGNYVRGIHGGAVVAGLGAIATFLLILLSK